VKYSIFNIRYSTFSLPFCGRPAPGGRKHASRPANTPPSGGAPARLMLTRRYHATSGLENSSVMAAGSRQTWSPARLVKYSRDGENSLGFPSAQKA